MYSFEDDFKILTDNFEEDVYKKVRILRYANGNIYGGFEDPNGLLECADQGVRYFAENGGVWECNGQLEYFDSLQEAQTCLNDFFDEMAQAHFNGEIEDLYDRNDYRIVEVNHG